MFPYNSLNLSPFIQYKSHLNRIPAAAAALVTPSINTKMGSFIGHVVPGSFFGLFGAWYVYQVFLKYFMCQRAAASLGEKGRSFYQNTSSFVCSCCPTMPLEGFLKIAAAVLGMIGE